MPTNTPTATATNTATPEPLTGVGLIGDSNTEYYASQCADRGNSTSLNWAQIYAQERGVDFGGGPCGAYNAAHSGDTTDDINNQIDDLEPVAGELDRVIFWIGWNDITEVCNGSVGNLSGLIDDMVGDHAAGIQRLGLLGIDPDDIYVVEQTSNRLLPCDEQGQADFVVAAVNDDMETLAASEGFHVLPDDGVFTWLANHTNGSGDIEIDGVVIDNPGFCNSTDCLLLSDNHAGTVLSAVIGNEVFAPALGVQPLSDAEILEVAGLD